MKTLILDCCHLTGMNCGEELNSEQYLICWISNTPQIESNTDKEIWSHRTRGSESAANGFCGMNTSHILLATCGYDHASYKDKDIEHGIFTHNLMKVLWVNNINTLAYKSLIDKMPKDSRYVFIISLSITEHNLDFRQTAHCEGQEIDWQLFNSHEPGANNFFILARDEIVSGMVLITLDARAAQGITVNSQMAIYAFNLLETAGTSNPHLGNLTATSVKPFTSILSLNLQIPPDNFGFLCTTLKFTASLTVRW